MIKNEELIRIIEFWNKTTKGKELFNRDIIKEISLSNKEIIDIIGVRRSGKSSILKILINKLQIDNYLFINFEDPFFIENNSPKIIEELIDVYKEYFSKDLKYIFFDEIHTIPGWERSIRKLRDSENYKIFITGSSSKLLAHEMSVSLTGRHISYNIFPLSFREFLNFKNINIKSEKDVVLNSLMLLKEFSNYMKIGGFPEVIVTNNPELLKQYFFDIVQKDIIAGNNIRQREIIEKLAVFAISNSSKLVSIESIRKNFGLSFEVASNYLGYLKDAFLILELTQFSNSLKTQQKSIKKIYCIDPGFVNSVSFKLSEDRGRILEQVVFLNLKRNNNNIYYYKNKMNEEVDFFIKNEKKLIQVSWSLEENETNKREVESLINSMNELKIKDGLILTYDEESELKIEGKLIKIMPVWKWLLLNQ